MASHRLDGTALRLRLKMLREERHLSMRELAERAGLSVSLISKVETGKVSPTVMSLQKLLDGLDIDLHDLLLDEPVYDVSEQMVFRKSDMAVSQDEDHEWYYAFPKHPDIKMGLTYEEYQPHTRRIEKESHKNDLCGYVISGELTIEVVGKGTFVLGAGDAFYIKAGHTHTARNETDDVLKLAAVWLR